MGGGGGGGTGGEGWEGGEWGGGIDAQSCDVGGSRWMLRAEGTLSLDLTGKERSVGRWWMRGDEVGLHGGVDGRWED